MSERITRDVVCTGLGDTACDQPVEDEKPNQETKTEARAASFFARFHSGDHTPVRGAGSEVCEASSPARPRSSSIGGRGADAGPPGHRFEEEPEEVRDRFAISIPDALTAVEGHLEHADARYVELKRQTEANATRVRAALEQVRAARLILGDMVAVHGTFEEMKRQLVANAMRIHGSQRQAARALGIPRSTMCEWVRRWRADASTASTE